MIDEIRVYDRALSTAEVQADMSQPLGITNPGAPTAPGNLTVTASTQTSISLGWTASTDDTGVSGYSVYVDGALAGTTTATSFTVTGLACSTGHQLEVEAFDAAGNTSPRASVSGSTTACGATPGLVAAYAFDEGSGSTANDASGNGKNGAIGGGAAWVTGHSGGALSFDGVDDNVALGSLGTFYNSAFTLEAWVQKTHERRRTSAVVGTWAGSGPMLWIDHLAGHHYATLGGSLSSYLDSGQTPSRRAVAAPGGHIRRRRPPATTSTEPRSPRAQSPAASATRTPGASAPTAAARAASSTAWSMTSASTTAL